MPLLRIVADDIGLSQRQNEHVYDLTRQGLLTGASLLVNYAPARQACQQLRELGLADIGLHLNLTDGFPLSPLPRGAALVNRNGRFRDRLRLFWIGWRIGARLRSQIRGELATQIERFCQWGAPPAHLSSHCHFHTLPPLSALVRSLADEYGIARIRAPQLRANLSPLMLQTLKQSPRGVRIANQCHHLALVEQWLNRPATALIQNIARCEGEVELVAHPGTAPDDEFPARFRYSPQKRALESAYLRQFHEALRDEPNFQLADTVAG